MGNIGHKRSLLAIRNLVEQADRYLAALSGPGLAEVRDGLARWRNAAYLPGAATATR